MGSHILTEVSATRIKGGDRTPITDKVILESPLTLFIDGEQYITLVCSPQHIEELVYGFLYSDAIIQGTQDVEGLTMLEEQGAVRVRLREELDDRKRARGRRVITSGCGKSSVFYDVQDLVSQRPVRSAVELTTDTLHLIMKEFDQGSDVFRATGGTHSCAICKGDQMLFFASDIGRHNALDKCVGFLLMNKIVPEECYFLSSGRISSEMVYKCMRAGIGVVASRAATTELAIKVAEQVNMTLIGFVRAGRMTIYTHPERVSTEDRSDGA